MWHNFKFKSSFTKITVTSRMPKTNCIFFIILYHLLPFMRYIIDSSPVNFSLFWTQVFNKHLHRVFVLQIILLINKKMEITWCKVCWLCWMKRKRPAKIQKFVLCDSCWIRPCVTLEKNGFFSYWRVKDVYSDFPVRIAAGEITTLHGVLYFSLKTRKE